MTLLIAAISARRSSTKNSPAGLLLDDYVARATRYSPTEAPVYPTEAALLTSTDRQPGRTATPLMLCDSTGDAITSEALADLLRHHRDSGTQRLLFGIGPADGWSKPTLARASKVISFGRITLPHELARVILAEQVYRALTILAGHPYHSGH